MSEGSAGTPDEDVVIGRMDRSDGPTQRAGLVIVGLLIGIVIAIGVAHWWPASEENESDRAQTIQRLRQIESDRLGALVEGDAATLERLQANDYVVVPPQGHPISGEELLDLVAKGDLDYQVFEPVSDIEVRLDGSAATMWYRSRIVIVSAGQGRFEHESWHLCRYEKRQGQWQLVREQTTAVGGFPP